MEDKDSAAVAARGGGGAAEGSKGKEGDDGPESLSPTMPPGLLWTNTESSLS